MVANPVIGVVYHWLGGLAAGSFYIPYKGVRRWAWETYWLAGGFFSWIVAPWVLGGLIVPHLLTVLRQSPPSAIGWAGFWGLMWGIGGLTFGLSVRYLGVGLGYAVALGYCAVFGTIMPPIFDGTFASLAAKSSGKVVLLGMGVCVAGIAISGMAGARKERELAKTADKSEFNFLKGILVATVAGILSASMSYGLAAAEPIAAAAVKHGTPVIWSGLPKLIVVLAGGFVANCVWCVFLGIKNRTAWQYASAGAADPAPMLRNYLLCIVAGVTWYLQFFFYTMGETQMGDYKFSSWTLHMASIIIFSTLWGVILKEWRESSATTKRLVTLGLLTLIASTVIVGYGNYLGTQK